MSHFAIKYPQGIEKLILLSPIGVANKPSKEIFEKKVDNFGFGEKMSQKFKGSMWNH